MSYGLDKKQTRKLATRFCFGLLLRFVFCGGAVLSAPFVAFVCWAADEILWQAVAIAALSIAGALWFCCWDFVRVAQKKGLRAVFRHLAGSPAARRARHGAFFLAA